MPAVVPHSDVLIAGAGPAGLALAVALARQGLRCTVLEQAALAQLAQPAEDGREIALTHRSRRILEDLGLWQHLPANAIAPLRQAQVHNGPSTPAGQSAAASPLSFDGWRDGHAELGWLVPNHHVRAAAWAQAQATPGIEVLGQTCVSQLEREAGHATLGSSDGRRWRAPLVVAADSRFSTLRRLAGIPARSLDFGRTAIVCRLQHTAPHQGIAHECFRHGLTLAMLPMPGLQCSAVLTVASAESAAWLALPAPVFASRVEQAFGTALGALSLAGPRHAYPLVAVQALRFAQARVALVGDAAIGMHPVTAHGYNFGLYGIATLAEEVASARSAGRDIGEAAVLQRYATRHLRSTLPIYLGTNLVARLFTDDRPLARAARQAVLRLAQALPPLRTAVARQLTGQPG